MTTRKDIKKLLRPSNNCSLWRLITDNHFDLLYINARETKGAIMNGKTRDTWNFGHMTQNEDKQNKNMRKLKRTNNRNMYKER